MQTHRMFRTLPALAVSLVLLSGCFGPGPKPDYDPGVTPADFVQGIDNPWLPWVPGAHWTYDAGPERIEVRVLNETRTIMGVEATVVRDVVTEDGEVIEDTYDWYAQDKDGNVWYLGEDSCEFEDGACADREGSWEWGVDGALPGVIMWADPQPGEPYFQEFYWPEAIDEAQVLARGETVDTAFGTFTDTLTTKEWTRLERGSETAYYVRGIGVVEKGGGGDYSEVLVDYEVPGYGG